MVFIRQKRCLAILVIWALLMIVPIIFLITVPSEDPTWITVGNGIKFISPTSYVYFKRWKQDDRLQWFEKMAQIETIPLHAASGWGYLSEEEYNSIVDHVLQEMHIKNNDSVFELGCGVGAALQRIKHTYGENISIWGSDLSEQAIKKVRETFPNESSHFYVLSMTQKNDYTLNDSKDHVISFGAFAMYLYREEMKKALEEAIRIARPGGHICFTHFIEPNGNRIGSILEPIEKSYWTKIKKQYFLENLIVKQMILQKDRYFICFSKRK